MGTIQQLIKFIPNLASLLEPIWLLLKKENKFNKKTSKMNYFHTKALENIKIQIPQMTDKETPTNKKVFDENVKRATKT